MLYTMNRYYDEYKKTGSLPAHALAEKHAKVTAHSIIHSGNFTNGGQNAYFYDSAEGLIAAVCLLVAEFCAPEERHIITVFKLILEFLEPSANSTEKKKETVGEEIIKKLPEEHKAKWLSGAALRSSGSSASNVLTTVMSRLLSFIDSESEQILCSDPLVTANQLCCEKVAYFMVFPEEDKTKHILVSLMVQQMYNSALAYVDEFTPNHCLPHRLYFFQDEFGISPKQDTFTDGAAAGRSKNLFLVPSIQGTSQIFSTYGEHDAKSIFSCFRSVICDGFAPLTDDAEHFSKKMGTQTVARGSISSSSSQRSSNTSKNISMISRSLMTPDELHQLPQFSWVVLNTYQHPFISKMPYWQDWGITYDDPFKMPKSEPRRIHYGNVKRLKTAIVAKYSVPFVDPSDIYEEEKEIEKPPLPEEPDMAAY